MGRIVGIDLGTTYSAVTVPEERTGEGFLVIPECPGCSVILDDKKNRITPSVVAENEKGDIVVGHPAKARAGMSPEPIMFAKRWMGEEKSFQLKKQGTLRPVEVSAHILRYLKGVAERRLGEPVDEAVITVPAYFSLAAKQMTEKAAKMAGLHVAQIAQEPVAAGLMYCLNDPRDPLKVMTYDLGGGTFDVAILEKRDGVISTESIRSFDGDRFLGGSDFDLLLTLWLEDQLVAKGYDLNLRADEPSDRVIRAKLLVYAERAKIALSREESYEFQEPSTGIVDHSGNSVTVEMSITREQFEDMIRAKVERSIDLCKQAQAKAKPPVRNDELQEILLVGGSSRIPLVQRRLEEEYGRRPRLVSPDLCVALGAGILAGTKGKTVGCLKLDPVPSETDLPSLTVTGRLVPTSALPGVEGCTLVLRAADGAYDRKQRAGAEGKFVFQNVTLAPEAASEFALSVSSPSGAELANHRFTVTHRDAVRGPGLVEPVTNMLSKPISIELEAGPFVIAPERTPLPYERVVRTKTTDISGEIRVPILEEAAPLGEIHLKEIPTTLAVGSTVEVTVSIQANYQILGRAWVPSLAREGKVVIDIPVRPQKKIEELQREYELLAEKAKDAQTSASKGKLFGGAKVKQLEARQGQCEEMLKSRAADPAAIQDCLDEIEGLVRDLSAGWRPEPPRAVFEQKDAEAAELLASAIQKRPAVAKDGYDRQRAAIRTEADKAYAAQNSAAWKDSFEKLVKLCDTLEAMTEKKKIVDPEVDPAHLLLALAQELNALGKWAETKGRYEEFKQELEELAAALKRINPKQPDATNQIRDWYCTRFEDLQKRLRAPKRRTGITTLDEAVKK